jgi:hypothetical protein
MQKMHRTKKTDRELDETVKRLHLEAEERNRKLMETKIKEKDEFEKELQKYFRPQLISKEPPMTEAKKRKTQITEEMKNSVFEKLHSESDHF